METVIGTVVFFFVLIWAFRVEIGVNRANESIKRIEKDLNLKKKEK